jgi:hypothetical protein
MDFESRRHPVDAAWLEVTLNGGRNMSRGIRKEMDSLGEVDVPADKLWGAQTQRSRRNGAVDRIIR